MDGFFDISFPKNGSIQDLSRIIAGLKYCLFDNVCLMNRNEGEYRISPVTVAAFDKWANSHPQFPYGLQFANQCIVVTIMLPPHDGAAGIIAHQISRTVDRMCPMNDANFWSRTGCIPPLLGFLTSSNVLE